MIKQNLIDTSSNQIDNTILTINSTLVAQCSRMGLHMLCSRLEPRCSNWEQRKWWCSTLALLWCSIWGLQFGSNLELSSTWVPRCSRWEQNTLWCSTRGPSWCSIVEPQSGNTLGAQCSRLELRKVWCITQFSWGNTPGLQQCSIQWLQWCRIGELRE